MGIYESYLAARLIQLLAEFVREHQLGIVLGADGMRRLTPGVVRIPDVSFISWNQLPVRRVPQVPIADLGPDLAVEVISPSNTAREMEQNCGNTVLPACGWCGTFCRSQGKCTPI